MDQVGEVSGLGDSGGRSVSLINRVISSLNEPNKPINRLTAHFWFVTLHPFNDGNGRLTRAITHLALAQAEHHAIRFHAMSASILADRAGYYRVLEFS
jgi:Fic family protein